MQALATPIVSILDADGAFTFSRRADDLGEAGYEGQRQTFDELKQSRPGTVFESGARWQMIPSKLYRHEDREVYVQELHPTLGSAQIGVIALHELEAMGIFDREPQLDESLYSGNHLAELHLDAATSLSAAMNEVCLVFFQPQAFWVTLLRGGRVILYQSFRYSGEADAVFYIAALLQHYGLERDQCPVVVGGAVVEGSLLQRQLTIYFDLFPLAEIAGGIAASPALRLLLAYEAIMCREPVVAA